MAETSKIDKATARVRRMVFGDVYPLYVQKAQRKGRTEEEVDRILQWLTGYTPARLREHLELRTDLEAFFAEAPAYAPLAHQVTGVVCGVRVEEVADPVMRKVRILDKMIDELAKGKPMEKILRT